MTSHSVRADALSNGVRAFRQRTQTLIREIDTEFRRDGVAYIGNPWAGELHPRISELFSGWRIIADRALQFDLALADERLAHFRDSGSLPRHSNCFSASAEMS